MAILEQPGCKRFAAEGIVVFECNRGMKPKVDCSTCGSLAQVTCDFPLRGEKAGQACGRPLCLKCSTVGEPHLCGPHARVLEKGCSK